MVQRLRGEAMETEAQLALQSQLLEGEHLLWAGRPPGGFLLRPADALMIPFSLFWCGFAIFWEYSVIHEGAPFFFGLWGIPFVLVGLYIVVGRFFFDAWQRQRTRYGITDKRVLIVTGSKLTSLHLRSLSEVSLSKRSNGRGTIILGASRGAFPFQLFPGWSNQPGRQGPPTLELRTDVQLAYDILTKAQQAA